MTPRFAPLFTAARLALVAVAATACASSGYLTPSTSATTLMAGWERHFAVDWTTEPQRGGARRIVGHLTGLQGECAEPVRVLAQGSIRPAPSWRSGSDGWSAASTGSSAL